MAAARGGQVLVSQTTRELLAGEFELLDLGLHELKDLGDPEQLYELVIAEGEPPSEPVREERKLVSVIVAEFVGLKAVDPEDLRAALVPFHACVREQVERFGGTIETLARETATAFF